MASQTTPGCLLAAAAPGADLKTSEIADAARAWTLLITCTATEPVASAKR